MTDEAHEKLAQALEAKHAFEKEIAALYVELAAAEEEIDDLRAEIGDI
jgi:uncharacterized coiled-coil DUF342 family protein